MLLLGLPTLLYPYGRDQAMFAYVGAVWREGGLPYRDAWDVKPPAIYAVYALVGGTAWGPRLLDLLAACGGVAALTALGKSTKRSGILAASLALFYTFGAMDYWNLAQAETLIGPLAAAAVVAGLARRPWIAGALAGTAAAFKTPAALVFAPVLLALLWRESQGGEQPRRGLLLPVLVGGAVPSLLLLLYFLGRGGLPYLGELLATQAEYVGGDPRLAGRPPWEWLQLLDLTGYLPLALLSTAALPFWLRDNRIDRRTRIVIAVWWFAALAQVVLQRRFYLYHWSVFTPAAAWLAADGLSRLWSCAGTTAGRRVVGCGVLILGLVSAARALSRPAKHLLGTIEVITGRRGLEAYQRSFDGVFRFSVGESRDAAAHVRRNSRPGDGLLVLGFEPLAYLESDRRPPSRHVSTAPLLGELSIAEERRRRWMGELLRDVHRRPPLYLVEQDEGGREWPLWAEPLREFRFQHYQAEGKYGGLRVWRRKTP